MKVKSRNMLRVPGWFNQVKKAGRSRITHKIYQSFAPVLISIKISNIRIIDSKIELLINQFAIWLMREQIVTEPIWRPSHPSWVRGLKLKLLIACIVLMNSRTLHGCVDWNKHGTFPLFCEYCRTLHGCVDWNKPRQKHLLLNVMSHPSWVRGLKSLPWLYYSTYTYVAPFMGAWIEIDTTITVRTLQSQSHPSWVRGLKYS